jgi:hypothetical protein
VKIWFPLAILLSVGWLLLVSALVSRGGDSGAQASDAVSLLRQSQAAMLALDSFQLDYTNPLEGSETTYRVVWESPDNLHVLYPYVSAEYETGKEPVITDRGFDEVIVIGERAYTRWCAAGGQDCQPWEENARPRIYSSGSFGQYDPLWTIDLLRLMSDGRIVGREDVGGVASIRISGEASVVEATVYSLRRAEETRGPLDWGEECTAAATEPAGETQEKCHERTLDEYIATLEESAAEENMSGPGPVEVWVGEGDRRVRRLDLLQSTAHELVVAASFTFSRFNEVTVQAPK